MPRHRYLVLDSYRFVAALGIVAYHFEAHFSPFLPHPREALAGLQTLVDFFFVLSGFVLAHSYGDRIGGWTDYVDFLRKRFARIYPLHAATLAFCVALFLVVRFAAVPVRDPSVMDMTVLVPNLLLVHAWGFADHPGLNAPSWSISAEAFVYILFPLFVFTANRLGPALSLGVAGLAAVIIEFVRAASGLPPGTLATFDFGMMRAVPMFLSGVAVHAYVAARAPKPLSWLVPHGLFAVILALAAAQAPLSLIDVLYPPLVALIAIAERGGRPTRLASPAAVKLGAASFAIYMLHTFVQIACVALVRRTGWTSLPQLSAVALGGTILVVGLGLLSVRFFETPARLWIGGVRRARSGGEVASARSLSKAGAPN